MNLDGFNAAWIQVVTCATEHAARVAYIVSPTEIEDGTVLDHAIQMLIPFVDAGWHIERRIIVPYSTEQASGPQVIWARENKRMPRSGDPETIMNFQARMGPALAHELAVIERFNAGGWCAYPFGQGQLPKQCRRHLAAFEDGAGRPSLIRWMPDVIAFRELRSGRTQVVLVDAKVCGDKTQNCSLELSAIETAAVYADKLYTPTFFVFDDWNVVTPREARQRGRQGPDPQPGHGSGTAYLLIAKRWSKPFDQVFRIVAERHAS